MQFFSKLLLCALGICFFIPSANAQQMELAQSFDVVVSGSVREQCELGSIGDMDFGNLERSGLGSRTNVAFYCNVPFTMTITGERGALTHTTMPNGQGGFSGAVPYSLAVELPVRHPHQRTLLQRFTSRQIRSGGVIASNGGIATDNMVLDIELAPPSSTQSGLLAGEYTETITITVAPL